VKTLLRNIILLLPKYHVAFAAEVSGMIANNNDDGHHYHHYYGRID
jgi:hypothetical protein